MSFEKPENTCQCCCECDVEIVDKRRKFCTDCDKEHRQRIIDRVMYS